MNKKNIIIFAMLLTVSNLSFAAAETSNLIKEYKAINNIYKRICQRPFESQIGVRW